MKRIRLGLLLASVLLLTGCGRAGPEPEMAARREAGAPETPPIELREKNASEEAALEPAREAEPAGDDRRLAPPGPPATAPAPAGRAPEESGAPLLRRLPPPEQPPERPAERPGSRPPGGDRTSSDPFRMSLQPERRPSLPARSPGLFGPLPGRTGLAPEPADLAPRALEPAAREPLEAAAPPPERTFRMERREAAAPPEPAPVLLREATDAPPPAAGTPEPAPPPDGASPSADHALVRVFYATDRGRATPEAARSEAAWRLAPPGAVAAVAVLLALAGWLGFRRRLCWSLAVVGLVLAGLWTAQIASRTLQTGRASGPTGVVYGNQRGKLEYGVCDVSIPPRHEVGELETPSILRLEVRPDAAKHVLVQEVIPQDPDKFFAQLRDAVDRSPKRDLFVFVHGFNVTFEKAARRTAQMCYDLKFQGAPIFYSWPSQGGLLGYTIDETNVAWTVPHLKQFLLDVVHHSDADAVNLIAHSMGNRALTGALRELALELRGEASLFNQVILAAPDIDAEVFRRDIAPAIVQTAQHVTLYASSDDEALAASKQVHGYPRAGDSGDDLVVVPGIDTIDVSGIDTSLLGHSYYGGSGSILNDLYSVIHDALPASQRRWLHPLARDGLVYWAFQASQMSSGRAEPEPLR